MAFVAEDGYIICCGECWPMLCELCDLDISSIRAPAEPMRPRKLKAKWSIEENQDLKAFHELQSDK